MAIALSALGMVFAAFCVWLTVRIVNRQQRWAKRALAAIIIVLLLYLLSWGPVCRFSMNSAISGDGPRLPSFAGWFYAPLGHLMLAGPRPFSTALRIYTAAWMPDPVGVPGDACLIPCGWDRWTFVSKDD
jgi:hypothetical protein